MTSRTKTVLALTGYALPLLVACYEWRHRRVASRPHGSLVQGPW